MKKLFSVVCFAWLVLSFAPFSEAYVIGCGNHKTPPCCPNNAKVGANPIKPYNANEQREVTDLETYGYAPIQFTRIYNSRTTDFTTNYMEFGWKQTWQHNWNYEMRDLTTSTHGIKNIKVRYPDGADFNFVATDTNGLVRVSDAFFGSRLYQWTGTNVGYTLVTPSGWEYDFRRTFPPRYQLLQVRNGQGAAWDLTYGDNGRLQRIANGFGRWLEVQRTSQNGKLCVTGVQSSDGRAVTYGYDVWESITVVTTMVEVVVTNISGGDDLIQYVPVVSTNTITDNILTRAHYPDGTQAEYTYAGAQDLTDGRPLLATASDPRYPGPGSRMKYLYNYDAILDFGNGPYLVTGTTLEERSLDTDETVVRMPLGSGDYPQILLGEDEIEVTHIYTNGLLIEQRDEEGRPTYYSYDQGGTGYLESIMDAESNMTSFVRDYAGRILQQVDPLGFTNSFTYNDEGFLLTHTNPLGHATAYTRDTNNLPTRIDYPDGSYEEWIYNAYGQPLTNRLRNGGVVTYTYYGTNDSGGVFGDLKTVIDPMSNITTYTWNSAGLPASIMDARTNTTRFAYDWRGRLLATTNADNTVIAFHYDAFGNRTNSVDELGHSTTYTYDQYNRVHAIRDPLGRTNTFEYGRIPGCGGCGVFDATITRITDPAGKITEYAYDRSGKRTNETIAAGTPEAATTAWTYDAVGRKQTQLDANGNLHTWFYDATGRVVAESNAMGEVTTYAYDAVGNNTNRVDGAGVVAYTEYDAVNRVVVHEAGNLRYEYAYNIGGQLTSVFTRVDGVITESAIYSYDLNGRMATKTDPSGYVQVYEYDSIGNRTRFSVSNVLDVSYVYDLRNRLTEILGNGKSTQFEYDTAGRRTNAVWPNGTRAAYVYDDAGQLLSLVHGKADSTNTPIASFTYGYNLSGNRTNMLTLEGTNSYTYDARDWLSDVSYSDGLTEEFAYDPVGNRTSLVQAVAGGSPITTEYDYGPANRLLSSASSAETNVYTYDDAGRLVGQTVNGQARAYGYDFMSRMTSLTDTNGSVFSYAFDGEGNRIHQSLNDCLLSRLVYDGPTVVMELNSSNEVVCAYVNGPRMDQPIERITFINGTIRQRQVFHADGLGSIAALTDEIGTIIQTYAYEAFGKIRFQTGPDLNRITYTAREAIGDRLGFTYYRNRVYDPNTGRFTSEDPMGFADGPNRYVYVLNNPINFYDPDGLLTWAQVGYFAAGVAIGAIITVAVIAAAPVAVSALVTAGMSTTAASATVTVGLGLAGGIGLVSTGINTYQNGSAGNWNAVAYNAGTVVGGLSCGVAGGGRALAGLNGTPSSVPKSWNPFACTGMGYNSQFLGGSILAWLGSAPTPSSGGLAATGIGSGIATLPTWFPNQAQPGGAQPNNPSPCP